MHLEPGLNYEYRHPNAILYMDIMDMDDDY